MLTKALTRLAASTPEMPTRYRKNSAAFKSLIHSEDMSNSVLQEELVCTIMQNVSINHFLINANTSKKNTNQE